MPTLATTGQDYGQGFKAERYGPAWLDLWAPSSSAQGLPVLPDYPGVNALLAGRAVFHREEASSVRQIPACVAICSEKAI